MHASLTAARTEISSGSSRAVIESRGGAQRRSERASEVSMDGHWLALKAARYGRWERGWQRLCSVQS